MTNNTDLNLLIALDVLLTEGSVAGAARRLGLSASAMSRTLSRLRDATGDALLVRAGRGMVLTPHAQAIRDRARQTAQAAEGLLRPVQSGLTLATLNQIFTLRTNDGFVEAVGPALIAAAAQEAPGVCLNFVPKLEKYTWPLREGRADLEIGVCGEMGPEIRIQALFRDRFVGVVRENHPLAQAGNITAENYTRFGHVVASRRGQSAGPVDKALATTGLTRHIAAIVPGFPAALAMARASDLVALVPASLMGSQPAGLWAFSLPVDTDGITVSQMWHPRSEQDPAHRWLRGLVLRVCRQLMGELK